MNPMQTRPDNIADLVISMPEDRRLELHTVLHRRYKILVTDPAVRNILENHELKHAKEDVEAASFNGNVAIFAERYDNLVDLLTPYGLIFPDTMKLLPNDYNGNGKH